MLSKVIYCENCGWTETELSDSGFKSAKYHEQLYGHKTILKEG